MPANKQKNNERAATYQRQQELRALDHLHEELSAAAQLSVQSSAKPSEKLIAPGTPRELTFTRISDPIWRPSSLHAHVQPTWASQPARNCGGHDGRDHACAPAVDLSALLQLTAWVERLDAINHMNAGEDQVILKIRSRAVHVLDLWARRWYVKSAMSDDDGEWVPGTGRGGAAGAGEKEATQL